ncbi:hypothetical protein [Corynebacterium neomassiliense]|uniref:hypothetical protein n=1 Tax=Corynebacterium neomassiliense TaxID=2079482 RepID=UPI00103196DA|nr:hypothetical protein [Corynebacterium neomassiliense]
MTVSSSARTGVWTYREWMPWKVQALILGLLAFVLVILQVDGKLTPLSALVSVAIFGGLSVMISSWTMRVDDAGFHWASAVGVPRKSVPHDEIDTVELVEVNTWDRGAWGPRSNMAGGTGLIRASGPRFCNTKSDGTYIEATCSDAETAVAALAKGGIDA